MQLASFKDSDITFFFSESNEDGRYTFESEKFAQIDGRSRKELSELKVRDIRSANVPQYIFDEMYDWTRHKGFWSGILENINKQNHTYWVDATIIKIVEKGVVKYGMVSTAATTEQIKKAQKDYEKLKNVHYKPEVGRKGLLYAINEESKRERTK